MAGKSSYHDRPKPDEVVEALSEQREWLRVTLASVGDAVITTDTQGRVTYLNGVAQCLTGWELDEAVGKPLERVFHIINEQTRQPVENPALRALREGVIVGLANHTLLVAKDGTERPIDDSAAPIRNGHGTVAGIVLIFRDITERREAERLIENARQFAEGVVETVRQPLVVLTPDLRVKKANRSFYQTFHVAPEETQDRLIYELGNGQWDIPRLRSLLEEILPQNTSFDDYEVEHDFPAIGPKIMLLNARRLYREGNHTELILLAIEDITERKQVEEGLKVSEVRYRRLFESAKDGILIIDAHSAKITDANPFIAELLGYPRASLIGKELWQIGLFKDIDQSKAAVRELQAKGYIRYEDLPLETRAGRRIDVEFVSNVYTEDHQPVIQCNIRDITERRKAEELLRESQQRLASLITFSNDAIISKSLDGIIQSWNAAAELLFGYTAKQAVGSPISLIIPADRADEERRIIARLLAGERVEHFETVRVRSDGQPVQVSLTISPIRDAADRVVGASKIARDISNQKRLEAALLEANRRKDEFLAMLGHELRNPLAPIRNALHLIRLSDQDPRREVRQAYDIIERQIENMVRLIDDLLDVARISSGKIQLQKQRIDLTAVVIRAIEGARPLIDARRHALQVSLPEAPVPVEADPVRLAQVLWNLLNNAAKYTPEGGRITLEVERHDEAVVRIRDTGMGIAPEMLPRVFDLFTQVERTLDRAEGGLGLGLTLVRRLTELHGGTVGATSAGQGQGSEFLVRLPLLADEPPGAGPTKAPEMERRVTPASGRRILVVDDNRDSVESLGMLLRLFGNDVRTVQDGRLALEAAAAYCPDVVLLDIGLPGLDGLEVCRRLRAHKGQGQPLIVALTGYGQEEDRRRSQEAGFDAHLVKPVDLEALQELLSRPDLLRHGIKK
jgi:PAS domain S-box-containing protein